MRPRIIFGTALALTLALPPSANSDPPQDFVTGGGHHAQTQFTISAHVSSGEVPRGNISYKIEDQPRTKLEVICLIVSGNKAIATARVVFPESEAGRLVVMEAVDNGEPAPGQTEGPDLIRFSFEGFIVPDPQNPGCYLPVLAPVPVINGNIVVHDGP